MIGILIALSFTSPGMVGKVTKATPTEEVVVVVHQRPEFLDATVSLLDQPTYAHSPRVVLTDGAASPVSPSLRDRATLVQYSKLGEHSLKMDVKTVTLMGGAAQDCLRTAGKLLITEILDRRNREGLAIRIPSRAVWGWKHEEGGHTLRDSFCKGSPEKFDRRVSEYAEAFITLSFPEVFNTTQSYQVKPGRASTMDYSFVFTRKSDGKKVNLLIEQLCDGF